MSDTTQLTAASLAQQIKDLTDEVKAARDRFEQTSGRLVDEIEMGLGELERGLAAADGDLRQEEARVSEQFDNTVINYIAETERAEEE